MSRSTTATAAVTSDGMSRGLVTVEFVVPSYVGGSYADLVAEFVSWVPLPMDLRVNGDFVVTVRLQAGRRWRYRFLIDGERWVNDFDADEFVSHPDGGDMSVLRT